MWTKLKYNLNNIDHNLKKEKRKKASGAFHFTVSPLLTIWSLQAQRARRATISIGGALARNFRRNPGVIILPLQLLS